MGEIILGGNRVVLSEQPVQTWEDHGLRFDRENTAEARRFPPRWVVLHWTASERNGLDGAGIIFNSLLRRRPVGLSVEFFVDNEGTVFQFADPDEVRCRHASRVNDSSIGIEVSAIGYDRPGRHEPRITETRPRYRSPGLHGGWRPHLYDYFPVQQKAVNKLVEALLIFFGIEDRVELEPWSRRPKFHFDEREGVCGHIHCASLGVKHPKIDPGPNPLIALDEYLHPRL